MYVMSPSSSLRRFRENLAFLSMLAQLEINSLWKKKLTLY